MENKETLTQVAFRNPSRGDMFSEFLAYWVCVIDTSNGISTLEGTREKLALKRYADPEEFQIKFRYTTIDDYYIHYHNSSEENAIGFEKKYVEQQISKSDKRNASLELLSANI